MLQSATSENSLRKYVAATAKNKPKELYFFASYKKWHDQIRASYSYAHNTMGMDNQMKQHIFVFKQKEKILNQEIDIEKLSLVNLFRSLSSEQIKHNLCLVNYNFFTPSRCLISQCYNFDMHMKIFRTLRRDFFGYMSYI